MSYASLLSCTGLYILRKADLTSDISDIVMDISRESRKTAKITEEYSQEKQYLAEEYGTDSTEYEEAVADLREDYNCEMEDINNWEKDLETQKQTKETELAYVTTLIENFQGAIKQNVKTDFTYGQK